MAGERVADRYRIVRFIAKGGMGEVYEAEDLDLGGKLALKTVRGELAEEEKTIQRFKREIQLARKVSHPNVCRIFDLGRHRLVATQPGGPESEVLFLTMELLDGRTLSQRLKEEGKLAPEAALPIVRQMAQALTSAHEVGIVHRDFKSPNVILVPTKTGERVVVTDFGLARGGADSTVTGTGDILGTPAYMAPEQVQGGKLGPGTDVYALGVVIYEMVTGALPFEGDSALSVAVKRLTEEPKPPSARVAGLDPTWEKVILRCLERLPEDRFASAADVVRALAGEAVAPPRRRWRRPLQVSLGVLAGLLIAVAVVARFRTLSRAVTAPETGTTSPSAPAAVKLRRAVAVIGFKNLGRPEASWLSTAISEMLRTELAAGGGVQTVPGETVARMKLELALAETDSLASDTLAKIKRNVGADYVVLGSYLSVAKGKLRIDLRLQDAEHGEMLASSSAEGTEDGVFQLVAEAGGKLRTALNLGAVSRVEQGAVRAAFPAHPEAAQLYSQGIERLRVFDPLGAKSLLEQAASAEPKHPLVHAALASAWSSLGYDAKATAESQLAFDLSKDLAREDRLAVQGLHYETIAAWDKAIETYRALLVFFPDRLDYGLKLAGALASAGQGKQALAGIADLRRLPPPVSDDPRIDLAEAAAAKALTDFPTQAKAAEAAAAKAQQQGSRLLFAQARLAQGTALVNLGKLDAARKACEEAGEIFAAAGDSASVARSENIIAVAYARSGDLANARSRFQDALKAFQKIGDKRGILNQLSNVGAAALRLNNPAEAKALDLEALAVAREIGDRSGVARSLNNLAIAYEHLNDLPASQKAFEDAIETYRQIGEKRNEALAISNLGEILHKQKRPDAAIDKYKVAIKMARDLDAKGDAAITLALLAEILVEKTDLVGAKQAYEDAIPLFRADEDKEGEARALRGLAAVLQTRGDKAGADASLAQAAKLEKELKGAK